MQKQILAFLLLILLTVSTSVHAKDMKTVITSAPKVFNAKNYTLDNGLQVVVIENHRTPVVTHMIWYRAGAADEPRGKSGIAHFLEHLLFKGQKHPILGNLAPGEFSKIIRAWGGEDNAFTSQDYTAYYQSVSSDHLEDVMRMEAGRMRGVDIPEEEFAAENKVIQEERRQRTDNDPRAQMGEQMREALFPNHPYAIPIIGWMHEIQNLKWADAKEFYDLYYAPNNAILVVSGDVTGEEVYEIAKRTYGIIERANTPERVRTSSPPFIAKTRVSLTHKTIKEPILQRTYRVPSYRQDKQRSLALQVLEDIVGGNSTSRLYKALVIEQKLASNISLSYSSAAWDDATLTIAATPLSAADITKLENAIDAELRKLIINGVTEAELKDSITRMQAEAIYARDSLSGPAMIIGYSLITGSTLDDIEYWPENIKTITKEQIQEVATLYLNPDQPSKTPPVTGTLLPTSTNNGGENE